MAFGLRHGVARPIRRAEAPPHRDLGRVVNLTFHGVGTPTRRPESRDPELWLTSSEFEAILDAVIGREDVRLTFDDGYVSDIEVALPALEARNLSATFFVVAARLGKPGHLSASDLVDLSGAGMTIGLHGMSHRSWRGLDDSGVHAELIRARKRLEEIVGRPVTQAACPFGAYDRRVLRRLRALGYTRVFTSDGGIAAARAWLQPRNTLRRGEGALALARISRAGLADLVQPVKRAAKRWR